MHMGWLEGGVGILVAIASALAAVTVIRPYVQTAFRRINDTFTRVEAMADVVNYQLKKNNGGSLLDKTTQTFDAMFPAGGPSMPEVVKEIRAQQIETGTNLTRAEELLRRQEAITAEWHTENTRRLDAIENRQEIRSAMFHQLTSRVPPDLRAIIEQVVEDAQPIDVHVVEDRNP